MLNDASTTFITILVLKIIARGLRTVSVTEAGNTAAKGIMTNFNIRTLKTARTIFVTGPAAAERAMPCLGFLKFIGFIGTGFA